MSVICEYKYKKPKSSASEDSAPYKGPYILSVQVDPDADETVIGLNGHVRGMRTLSSNIRKFLEKDFELGDNTYVYRITVKNISQAYTALATLVECDGNDGEKILTEGVLKVIHDTLQGSTAS